MCNAGNFTFLKLNTCSLSVKTLTLLFNKKLAQLVQYMDVSL